MLARLVARAALAELSRGRARTWLRRSARAIRRQPRAPLRPGAGAGGRAAGRCASPARPLPAHARPRSRATPRCCAACPGAARPMPRTSGPRRTGKSARSWPPARWLVTCTAANRDHLAALAPPGRVDLVYHGLDAGRFPRRGPRSGARRQRSGRARSQLLSVGRAGREEGHRRAARGAGPAAARTCTGAACTSAAARCAQAEQRARRARPRPHGRLARRPHPGRTCSTTIAPPTCSCCACRIAARRRPRRPAQRAAGGAAARSWPCVSDVVSAIPELIEHGVDRRAGAAGSDPTRWRGALDALIRDPARRAAPGRGRPGARRRDFRREASLDRLAAKFGLPAASDAAAARVA